MGLLSAGGRGSFNRGLRDTLRDGSDGEASGEAGGEEEMYEEQQLNVHTRVGNQAGVVRVFQGFTGSSGEQRGGAGLVGERGGGGGGTVGRRLHHTTQERRGRGGAPPRDWEEDGVRRGRRWRAGERLGEECGGKESEALNSQSNHYL